jgi:hypothetical protein
VARRKSSGERQEEIIGKEEGLRRRGGRARGQGGRAKGVRRKGSGGKEGRYNWEGRRAIGEGGGIGRIRAKAESETRSAAHDKGNTTREYACRRCALCSIIR